MLNSYPKKKIQKYGNGAVAFGLWLKLKHHFLSWWGAHTYVGLTLFCFSGGIVKPYL